MQQHENSASRPLTDADVDQYRRLGYLMLPAFFDRAYLLPIEHAIERLTDAVPPHGTGGEVLEFEPEPICGKRVARRIFDPFERDQSFRDLATHPHLLDVVESVIGAHFGLHHSKLNMKPAQVGSAVEWHQDLAYFPHTNDDLVAALIYLDDTAEDNGCLQVLPGRHHAYLDHANADGGFAGMITEPIDQHRHGAPLPLPGPAGSLILMHSVLPHASLPNRSLRSRRTLIFEYRASDSFPIHYGPDVARIESFARHLRGQRSAVARFGGPPPIIPRLTRMESLYEMQRQAKAAASGARA
jgi:phytanoyl-CoA hydroxylase